MVCCWGHHERDCLAAERVGRERRAGNTNRLTGNDARCRQVYAGDYACGEEVAFNGSSAVSQN